MDAPTPTRDAPRRPRRPILLALLVVLLLVVAGGSFVLANALRPGADETGGAPLATPSLQELAEQQPDTASGGERAPDFSVRTTDGSAFTLSRHLEDDGRPVILNLWASWCFPCRAEMPALDAFAAAHPEVVVVGVAVQDDPVAAAEFAEEIGVSYTIGFDEKDEVNVGYRALGLPATFFVSSDGMIVKRVFGGVTEESLLAELPALTAG